MIAVALLALALWIPGTLYPMSDTAHTVFRVAVCLAACGTGIAVPRGRLVRWGLALWGAGIVASVVLASDPWRAAWSTHNRNEGAWQVGHYLVLLLVAAAAPRERLVRWVALAATAAASYAALPLGWVGGRLAGSTGNPLYLAPLLVVGIWGAWRAGGRWRLLVPVLAAAAAATQSKGLAVALVVAAAVWAFSRAPRSAAGVAVAAAVGLWFVPIPDSGLIRLELGRVGLTATLTHPLGWGAEGFSRAWDALWLGVAPTGETWHDRAHCLLLDRAIEWGWVGVAGWLMVAVAAWRRAELPERMALGAWLAYHMTMFEMMWGAAAFACLLGWVFNSTPRSRKLNRGLGLAWAIIALVVGAAQLAQSSAASRAADFPAMQRAIEMWSPIGGDVIEVYLRAPQTSTSLEWAAEHIEHWSPHATQQAFILAAWDPRYCPDLLAVAPRRPDVRMLCSR